MRKYATFVLFIAFFLEPLGASDREWKNGVPAQRAIFEATLEMIDNQTTAVQIIRMINGPASPSKEADSPPSLEVRTPRGVRLCEMTEIRGVHFTGEERMTIVSDPSRVKVNPEDFTPLVSNGYQWHERNYDDTSWEKPVLAHPNYRWFYIPGASWIWRHLSAPSAQSQVLLLRRKFEVPNESLPRRAILYLTLDEILHETYLNGRQLPLRNITIEKNYMALDVTAFIRRGGNLLAMKLGKKPKEGEIFSGLAFRLDIDMISQKGGDFENLVNARSEALLENGDHIFGDARAISDRRVEIQTPYGRIKIDRDWVRRIGISPFSSERRKEEKNVFKRIFGSQTKTPSASRRFREPRLGVIYPEDDENRVGILLKSGEFKKGRIIKLDKNSVIFKPRYGAEATLDLSEIESLYPNESGKVPYLIYPREEMPWKCRIITRDNSEISGILTHLTPEALTVKPPWSEAIQLKKSQIVSCLFPYSSIAGLRRKLDAIEAPFNLSIALMGESDPRGPLYMDSLHFNLHNIFIELGIEDILLTPEEIVDNRIFFPKRFPFLFNIDETETYYKTVNSPDDGYNALLNYVKDGGVLVYMGAGIPGCYGYEPQNRHWKRSSSPPFLNAALGVNILGPGEVSEKAQAFEMPENKPGALYFELNTQTPYSCGLPERIEFPFHPDTRFRPIIKDEASRNALFTPIYHLKSEYGTNYGAAMAIIDYQGGGFENTRFFYVSHLIFTAKYNNYPVLYDLVPKIISLELARIISRKE